MAILDVLKYEGPNDVLVWKRESERYRTFEFLRNDSPFENVQGKYQ